MGIIPCEIPLLEFDSEQTAVIGPDYEQLDLSLPRKCVFAFLGGYIDRYAHAAGARQVATFNSATKLYPIYVTTYPGGGRRSGPAAGLAHQLRGPRDHLRRQLRRADAL